MTHVAVVGSWHNAFVTAACLAHLSHQVTLVNPGESPWTTFPALGLHEPGLDELLLDARTSHRLDYANLTDQYDRNVPVDVVWLAIDTPLHDDDAPDVEPLLAALRAARGRFPGSELLVIGSQVPLGFCQRVEREIDGWRVACVPENMRLGSGVQDFMRAERVVIGASRTATIDAAEELLNGGHSGSPPRVVRCDLPTAEMIKHATNTMLATQISLANELAMIGEAYGVDTQLVAKAMRMDSRIGPKAYVRPGLGFAGGTLPRDLRALLSARQQRFDLDPSVIGEVLSINEHVVEHIAQTVVAMQPRTACIMGYTYKADTDTLRRSPVKALATRIRRIGAGLGQDVNVIGHDPRFDGRLDDLRELDDYADRQFGLSHPTHMPWNALARHADLPGGVDLFLVVTPLASFRTLDWNGRAPAIVYDLCDGVDGDAVRAAGLSYKPIWQPILGPRDVDAVVADASIVEGANP